MKSSQKKVYIIELIILLFLLILVFFGNGLEKIMLIVFWNVMLIVSIILLGIKKDKNYLKSNTIRLVTITLLSALILIYMLGLFTGFNNSVFSFKPINIIKNVGSVLLFIVPIELVRYIIFKNYFKKNNSVIIFTILLIILDILIEIGHYNLYNFEELFKFICVVIFPSISIEFLCSYMTYKISYVPSLIYKIALNCYMYVLPIFPNLGEYIYAVITIIMPFVIFGNISKLIKYNEKKDYNARTSLVYIITTPIILVSLVVIVLASGIFRYKMIAIGSDSMNPAYYRGDAVIYDQKIKIEDIKKGDILVFSVGDKLITHRVVEIRPYNNDNLRFITKGDNNDSIDNLVVTSKDVRGVVIYYVKMIGKPSIWLKEHF